MINFIICDDNDSFLAKMKDIIDIYMMRHDLEYKCHLFRNYDSKFKKLAQQDIGFKVYLLDIQTEDGSGIDTARYIREELEDWNSIIIMITAYNEYKYEALGNRLFLLDFVNKLDECERKIKEDLAIVMKNYDNRHKTLDVEFNKVIKKIDFRHIVYIVKEKSSKRCTIRTLYDKAVVSETINNIIKLLDDRFIKSSRSTIINLNQIDSYDISENKILFKNGEVTYDISRAHKKGVIRNVKCIK